MGCGCESGFGARQGHWERVGGRGRVGVKAGGRGGGGGLEKERCWYHHSVFWLWPFA